MRTRMQKWGNSLAVRIPQPFAQKSDLHENSEIDLLFRNGRIVMIPVKEPEYSLSAMVEQITEENLHGEVPTGEQRGEEAW